MAVFSVLSVSTGEDYEYHLLSCQIPINGIHKKFIGRSNTKHTHAVIWETDVKLMPSESLAVKFRDSLDATAIIVKIEEIK